MESQECYLEQERDLLSPEKGDYDEPLALEDKDGHEWRAVRDPHDVSFGIDRILCLSRRRLAVASNRLNTNSKLEPG